jgi:hypothetical protein
MEYVVSESAVRTADNAREEIKEDSEMKYEKS